MITRRRLTAAVVVVLSVALAGCGKDASNAARSDRAIEEADLQRIKQAAEAVREAPTGRYLLVQSVQGEPEAQAEVVLTRRGQYDGDAGLHQVEVSVPPSDGDPEIELTFLNTGDAFLMRNPTFTARHGKPWTRLPSDAVKQALPGIGETAPLPEPPGLGVLGTVAAPGRTSTGSKNVTTYEVTVGMYESIELLSNNAYAKVAELSGVPEDDLEAKFAGTMAATVVLTDEGVQSLAVDLAPIITRAAELASKPAGATGEVEATVTFDPGAEVDVSVPAARDIGPFQ